MFPPLPVSTPYLFLPLTCFTPYLFYTLPVFTPYLLVSLTVGYLLPVSLLPYIFLTASWPVSKIGQQQLRSLCLTGNVALALSSAPSANLLISILMYYFLLNCTTQFLSQRVSQQVSQSVSQSASQSANQTVSQPVCQYVCLSVS